MSKSKKQAAEAAANEAKEAQANEINNEQVNAPETKSPEQIAEEKRAKYEVAVETANELRPRVLNHRCRVVPFNTIEWVGGVVRGVMADKRSGNVLIAIKTDDGRAIAKAYNSKLLEILDEIDETQASRAPRHQGARLEGEALDELLTKMKANHGMPCTVDGKPGRIHGVTLDKRTNNAMYRVKFDDEGIKDRHIKDNNPNLVIGEADDKTAEMQEAMNKRGTGSGSGYTPKTSVEQRMKQICGTFAKTYREYLAKTGAEEVENLLDIIEAMGSEIVVPEATED